MAHAFSLNFPFNFYLNHRQLQLHHKQFATVTKITRRNTMHKYTRSIPGNPSQQGKKTQPILCYILQEKTPHTIDLAHKRVLTNPRRLAPKKGVHFSQVDVLAEISKLTLVLYFLNGEFTFIYIRLDISKVVSIGTTGLTSITQNIINSYHINYILHQLSFTLWWGQPVPFTSQIGL